MTPSTIVPGGVYRGEADYPYQVVISIDGKATQFALWAKERVK